MDLDSFGPFKTIKKNQFSFNVNDFFLNLEFDLNLTKEKENDTVSSLKEKPKKPVSQILNEDVGRKIFPCIFLICSMLYAGVALWIYNMPPQDYLGQQGNC